MPKKVTERQKRFLLSKVSPLSKTEKSKFLRELMAGHVTIVKKKKKGGKK